MNRVCQLVPLSFLMLCIVESAPAQEIRTKSLVKFHSVEIDTRSSFRGLHVVDENVVWASGSNGSVLITKDGGKNWTKQTIEQATRTEFRDIQGFNSDRAIAMGIGSPAQFYSTNNGGKSWKLVYQYENPNVFFDALGFWNGKVGIAFSDPIDGKLFVVSTVDGGDNWKSIPRPPSTLPGEAGFAASGTCLATFGNQHVWIGLGGKPDQDTNQHARVVFSKDRGMTWSHANTTVTRGESSGIFSLCFVDTNLGFAIGGDYKSFNKATDNLSITTDGGKTWRSPKQSFPAGFRSCIAATKHGKGWALVATGTNGTDISLDLGESWIRASKEGFHAIAFVPGEKWGWATGGDGKLARFQLDINE